MGKNYPQQYLGKNQMAKARLRRVSHIGRDGLVYKIRLFAPGDKNQIISNVNKVITEGSYLAVRKFIMTDDWHKCLLGSTLCNQNRYILSVATFQGSVLGHCRLFPTDAHNHSQYVGEMGFVVLREYRNIGLGSALVSYVLEIAQSLGYKKIILHVASENKPAIHLADKFYFTEENRRIGYYFLQNKYMDEVLMTHCLV